MGDDHAAFVAERNEMLLSGDVDRLMAFHAKHNPGLPPMTNRIVAEITLHKSRTAAKGLPMEARLQSKRWLTERGYKSWDDGDLNAGRAALIPSSEQNND